MSWQAFSWSEFQSKVPPMQAPAMSALMAGAEFLRPLAVSEAALGFWRLGDDLGCTSAFFVNQGMFSHWQVWIAMSALTQAASVYAGRALAGLNRDALERRQ